jgi:ABC-type oligopeptide transport system substrate-binding subunit
LDGKSAEINGIQVIDAGTIRIQFNQPNAAFIFMLTNPVFGYTITEDQVEPLRAADPYKMKEIKDNKETLGREMKKYHRGMPALGGIKAQVYANGSEALAAYQAGGIDYLDLYP